MGNCCSCDEDERSESAYGPSTVQRRPTTSDFRGHYVPNSIRSQPRPDPLYGEFKCRCGHFWVSLLSWRSTRQICKRCNRQVLPKNQRELRPTDYTRSKDDPAPVHPKELCEMCQQLGRYCGRFNQ